jgi:hypothetical protein
VYYMVVPSCHCRHVMTSRQRHKCASAQLYRPTGQADRRPYPGGHHSLSGMSWHAMSWAYRAAACEACCVDSHQAPKGVQQGATTVACIDGGIGLQHQQQQQRSTQPSAAACRIRAKAALHRSREHQCTPFGLQLVKILTWYEPGTPAYISLAVFLTREKR